MPVMKVQPIDSLSSSIRGDSARSVSKSRLKRFFDRPFTSVLRSSSASEKATVTVGAGVEVPYGKDGGVSSTAAEFEPSSVCLDKMVQNFIEESNEKQPPSKIGRNRCNCFNGNGSDSSDDEFDFTSSGFSDFVANSSSFGDSSDTIKSLIPCESVAERNLLADTSKIIEKNKICKRKDDLRKIVADGLSTLGYNASICKSKWEKASSMPAGEYEYIDVIVEGERVLIDVDFRSEFEIARSTGSYNAVLQLLPLIFVGNGNRLLQIVSIMSEAARQSLKKKGMHIPPWRKAEYMKAKWLSPYSRSYSPPPPPPENPEPESEPKPEPEAVEDEAEAEAEAGAEAVSECGELDLIFGDNTTPFADENNPSSPASPSPPAIIPGEEAKPSPSPKPAAMLMWQPPAIKPKSCERGNRVIVTGLASLLKEKP
ncbi:uncharacterized protein LOC116002455 [Ipomoea triloba]|uniref:uncharacterized protein LOC116002455 n=1 Tax=Ipomoea triloba TaxID=35885 RepID=UPI00125D3A09|nr:uncharacterized protein LOC116002455 [Ipomoea triloba]